ncbi:MAG TPA: ABC transporter substrate-binding protein [Alphaproteobacteria bacterium]|nr:ABC transporter substrate-binding protein [Alphaproteobacteria bacterium]
MRRREFIAAAGAAALWPLAARAQQHQYKVGLMMIGGIPPIRDLEIVKELAKRGYVEGRNITYVAVSDDNVDQAIRTLVAAKPDIVVGAGSALAYAFAAAVHDIPIVLTATADPVATGLSASMSRPTGNSTGFTISSTSIVAKRLEILRELVPGLRKVGRLWVPASPMGGELGRQAQTAGRSLGIEIVSIPLKTSADIEPAFAAADKEHVGALMPDPDPLHVQFAAVITDECLIRDMPLMDAWPSQIQNGALAAYGPPSVENLSGAVSYVDRILKGAKVADLPFVEPAELKLAINLKTARSIGVTVPANLLALADDVVE